MLSIAYLEVKLALFATVAHTQRTRWATWTEFESRTRETDGLLSPILTHHKNLNAGDFLIDDRTKNGADRFLGEHLLFGSERFPDWQAVLAYLRER